MSSTVLIDYDILQVAVEGVIACEGECPITIELSTLLRYASGNEQPVSVSARDLETIESYL